MIPLPIRLYISLLFAVAGLQTLVVVVAFKAPNAPGSGLVFVLLAAAVLALTVSICVGKGHAGLRVSIAILLVILFSFWFIGWYGLMHSE